jgi:hypothetical protein
MSVSSLWFCDVDGMFGSILQNQRELTNDDFLHQKLKDKTQT